MVAVNSLLYFLLSAGLSSNPDQAQDLQGYDPLNGLDLAKLCPPNEQLSNCDAHCQKNCTNFAKPFPCPAICIKGCICKEGLVRASNGKCIQPKQCPGLDTCPRGEHYEQCTAHCQTNCTTLERPLPCPRLCAHGCVCDKGTVRGPKGKCIKPDKCPKKDSLFEVESSQEEVSESFCPPNEEYSHCSAHCQRDCSNWVDADFQCTNECLPGCVCKDGMVRGHKGQCMWPRQCPPMVEEVEEILVDATFSCPINEHFTRCDAYCQKNCSNHDQDIPCRKVCVWGCICDEGYTRGPDGKCIKIEECPEPETQAIPDASLSCPKDEVFSECEAHCQKNCTNWNKPIVCPRKCIKGCVCAKGLVRGQDGKCALPKQCPGKNVCPKGEHFDQCNAHCQRNCTTWGKVLPCPLMCVHGCVCDLGTVRGPKGKCIQPNQCPKKSVLGSSVESSAESIEQDVAVAEDADEIVCPKYEHLSACGAHCQKNCTNFDKPMFCPYICVKGCVCEEGYVRGNNGKCVKPEQCPVRDVCPRGEHFDMCQAHCQKNCTNWDKPLVCPLMCVKGCICNEGTVRGPHGRCVKTDKCPKRSFSELQEQVEDAPTYCTLEKVTGPCKGYFPRFYFNKETNKCEEFIYGGCEGNENNFEYKRLCEYKCLSDSRSSAELSSREESEVQAEELPTECTLEKKVGPCRGKFPRYYFNKETNKCEQFFYGGCQGNENNFWTKAHCERKCPSGSARPSDLSSREESEVKIEELPTECSLEKEAGPCDAFRPRYFFNKETMKCERFLYSGCRGNKNNFASYKACEKRCTKNSESSDIFWPPMDSQYSESSDIFWPPMDSQSLPRECTLPKKTGPCKGFYHRYFFNKETNQCELFIFGGCQGNENNFETKEQCEQNCSITASADWCPKNEEYSACKAHCPGNCKYQAKSCPKFCVSGCKCKQGYVRGPRGDCIELEECPSKELPKEYICPTNERFNRCVAHCQTNCTTEFVPCPRICVPGCICEEGYIRGLDGKCIPIDQCPSQIEGLSIEEIREAIEDSTSMYEENVFEEVPEISSQDEVMRPETNCPVNEHFDVCNFYCQKRCTFTPCHMICSAGCVCDDGFVRGPDGKCIKPELCDAQEGSLSTFGKFEILPLPKICQKNEVFSLCPCPKDCANYETKKCLICVPGCECKEGYVSGPDGTCIKSEECQEKKPADCTDLEFHDTCGSTCPDDCSNYMQQDRQCVTKCVVGCFCLPGTVRSPDGDCIFPFDCSAQNPLPYRH